MMNRRPALPATILLLSLSLVLAACAGGGAGASPDPSFSAAPLPSGPASLPPGATVDTPEAAWAAVVATEPRFANIQPQDPNLIGQSAWYEVMPASGVGAFIVRVTVGWGDCPAGCIDKHMWQFAVAPDGSVTLQSEEGDSPPPDAFPHAADGQDEY